MKKKILIGPSSFGQKNDKPLLTLKEKGFDVITNPFGRKISKNEIINLLQDDVIGLIAGLELLDNDVLSGSSLKVISRVGSGISNVDLDSLKKNNIKLYSIPEGPVTSVAELTVGMIINLFKNILPMNQNMHDQKWSRIIGSEVKGKNILIVGFGRIGKKVADILSTFEANILIVDPHISIKDVPEEFKLMHLDHALPIADVTTIHVSGENCLIGNNEFSKMKKGSIVCNASRGGVISESDLIRAVNKGIISAAWVDAFVDEPYYGEMSKFKEIILTPHIGSYTMECRENMEKIAVENLLQEL
jgi:D-3-phosphoglycerate dehydrogenase